MCEFLEYCSLLVSLSILSFSVFPRHQEQALWFSNFPALSVPLTTVISDDALRVLPLGGSCEHVLSHNKLWDAIFLDVPSHQRTTLQKMISSYNASTSSSWSDLSTELVNSSLSQATLDSIKKNFDIRGMLWRLHQLVSIFWLSPPLDHRC